MLYALIAAAVAGDSIAVHTTADPIAIDGNLNEAAWAMASPVSDFRRYQPVDGGAPPGQTSVRFLQDDKFLYVGITVSDSGYPMRARISPRESINADDQVGVYLDTFSDRISGYIFYFNALGIQQDIRHNAGRWNVSWDTVIRSKGHVTDGGFELEIGIPWRSLKFPSNERNQDWGVIVTRKIPHEGAKYSWPQLERGAPRIFDLANTLTGVQPPGRGSGFELVPSITAAWEDPTEEKPGPLDLVRPSFDLRFGITPDLGVAATLNPDFSQVESDVSDIRLNARFAFNFPERRPFFLDGVDWFEDVAGTLYTRSMNQPVYGVKMAGREGKVAVGALHVLDRAPLESFTEGSSPGFEAADVDGSLAATTLVRARTDAFGLGYAGVVLADKRILGGGSNQIGGVDFEIPLGDRWFATSSTLQSASGDGLTQLWGTQQIARIRRASGVGTGFQASFTNRSPGFRNELGFLTQSDLSELFASVDHTFTPGGALNTWVPSMWLTGRQEGNGDRYGTIGHGQTFLVGGIHSFLLGTWVQSFRESGVEIEGMGGRLSWRSNLGRALDLSVYGEGARTIDYGLLLPANSGQATATATLRPTPGIRTDTQIGVRLHRPKGADLQRTQLVRNRMNWQFSRDFGTRWVLDYSTGNQRDPRIYNALLLTWLRNPGTAVWVGGSVVNVPGSGATEKTLFAKATLLLRP